MLSMMLYLDFTFAMQRVTFGVNVGEKTRQNPQVAYPDFAVDFFLKTATA